MSEEKAAPDGSAPEKNKDKEKDKEFSADLKGFLAYLAKAPLAVQIVCGAIIATAIALSCIRIWTGEWPWSGTSKAVTTPAIAATPTAANAQAQSAPSTPDSNEWLSADPKTHIPYSEPITFGPGDVQTAVKEGGDDKTPGNHWEKTWFAPGPVTSVTIDPDPPYQHAYPCTKKDNIATCTGWINSGNTKRTMTVTWLQKRGNASAGL